MFPEVEKNKKNIDFFVMFPDVDFEDSAELSSIIYSPADIQEGFQIDFDSLFGSDYGAGEETRSDQFSDISERQSTFGGRAQVNKNIGGYGQVVRNII